ncbi:hypothetical protein SLNWT_1954 [Streptomyces albus]|uniref:Uncharacterized protein n=1 Tax=Streptomyces albus (strain ATCC 21838 / DSM 41398 / FERM P-419 / JCM 4703 / NBRC 107858) TaxID=1081613 RepID=A0A0B5ESV9_STRA4|nr:hypothetical protein SLNWT_1954 [Streptomyces albus]
MARRREVPQWHGPLALPSDEPGRGEAALEEEKLEAGWVR